MKKLVKAVLFLIAIAVTVPTMVANATNIKLLPFPSGSQPVTIATTDSTAHLLDLSDSDRTVTGVWVDNPQEFARSFKVEPVNNDPKMVAFTGVPGGSSRFTANLLLVDSQGNQYIQPIKLIKRVSEQNITRFVDRANEVASVPNNDGVNSQVAAPPTTVTPPATTTPSTTELQTSGRANIDLQQGSIAAGAMLALADPELQSRVAELVTAAKSGQDPYQAAQSIGISPQYVTKLIELGKTNRAPSQSATDSPEQK